MTPRACSPVESWTILLKAPRSLKLPMGCNPSALTQRSAPSQWTRGVCRATPQSLSWAARNSASVTNNLDFQNDGHDHGPARSAFLDVELQIETDFFFHDPIVSLLFGRRALERPLDDLLCLIAECNFAGNKSARHHFRRTLHFAGALVDGDDGQHQPILAQMSAIANDQVFDDIGGGTGIDANPAGRDLAVLGGSVCVQLEDVSVLQEQRLLRYTRVFRQLHVLLQMTIVAMDGNKELGPQQVDHQPHFFLTTVPAHVDQA